jgi:hypothetical protein
MVSNSFGMRSCDGKLDISSKYPLVQLYYLPPEKRIPQNDGDRAKSLRGTVCVPKQSLHSEYAIASPQKTRLATLAPHACAGMTNRRDFDKALMKQTHRISAAAQPG